MSKATNTAPTKPSFRSVSQEDRVAMFEKKKREKEADELRLRMFERVKQVLPSAMNQPDIDPTNTLVDQLSSASVLLQDNAEGDQSFTEQAANSQASAPPVQPIVAPAVEVEPPSVTPINPAAQLMTPPEGALGEAVAVQSTTAPYVAPIQETVVAPAVVAQAIAPVVAPVEVAIDQHVTPVHHAVQEAAPGALSDPAPSVVEQSRVPPQATQAAASSVPVHVPDPLSQAMPMEQSPMSLTVEQGPVVSPKPTRGRKPILGVKKEEKTFSFDPQQYERLMELKNREGLRLKLNISCSEILRELVNFALAHVVDNKVIPTNDGLGLHIPERKQV